MARALVIGAPRTGSGKTMLTLALLRAARRRGLDVGSAKVGPDFIDPRYHAAAGGAPCVNLDGWAMRPELIDALAAGLGRHDLVLIEGVMGLFDGAEEPGAGTGSTAEIARRLGAPVLLVIDAAGLGQSVAALAQGFARHDPGVELAGIVLNNVSSDRHRRILAGALESTGLPLLGGLPHDPRLARPSRHLGLVQAEEAADLEAFLDGAAAFVSTHLDLDALFGRAGGLVQRAAPAAPALAPLGQRIAVADDTAFRFAYPHILAGWRRAGAEILPFSPLADEAPDPAVFLPGRYPELHAGALAGAGAFRAGLRRAAAGGAAVYGECGGYMVLGEGLVDGEGRRHEMLGLLRLETSFADRQRHLGYRAALLAGAGPLGPAGAGFRAHEFHYSRPLAERGEPLFRSPDGGAAYGLREGGVMGSYLHLIDRADDLVRARAAA